MTKCWTLVGAMLLAVAVAAPLPAETPAPEVNIGIYKTMFPDINAKMLDAVSKPLKSTIEKTVGLSGSAILAPDADAVAVLLKEKKVQTGVFLGYEFAWIKQRHPDLIPIIVAVPPGGPLKAVIVVNTENPAKSVADLKDQTVAVAKMTKPHCVLFLDDLRKGLPATTAAKVNKAPQMMDEVLEAVAIGTQPAAVVDAAGYEAYLKTNPGNGTALKVIATSESFPFAVLAVHKDGLTGELRQRVIDGLLGAHNNGTGKAMMMIWGLKAFEVVPKDYDDQLAAITKLYPAPKKVVGTLTGLEKDKDEKKVESKKADMQDK